MKHTDALASVSFKLACGCSIPPSEPPHGRAFLHKTVGSTYECNKHGEQIIVRATNYFKAWAKSEREGY
jgi:hypothetical protein